MHRLVGGLLIAPALLGAPAAARAQDAPATHTLIVRVQTELERVALGYSVVLIPSLTIERFTSASGQVAMILSGPGPVVVRVKHLGYTPKDTTIVIGEAPSQIVVVALARVSFRLEEVRVVAWPPCERPGLRGMRDDAELRGIVEQLQQNAERYRLLTRIYPFRYTMQREFGRRAEDGSYIAESHDVILVEGSPDWSYGPGRLVVRELATAQWVMRIPSIGDLAEEAFVENHCFHVTGLELKEDVRLLRIDIVAAERLRGVDVHAVVWLDPTEYRLRHATFTLTKPPPQVRGLLHSTTSARYLELLPFVPVLERLTTENTVQFGRGSGETRVFVERQSNRGVAYTKERPDSLARDSLPASRPPR